MSKLILGIALTCLSLLFDLSAYAQVVEVFENQPIFDPHVEPCACTSNPQTGLSGLIESGTLTSLIGIDGSKQPQDFGANANLGVAARLAWSAPLVEQFDIGYQIGSRVTFTGNAVQVFELLGESKDRFQNFTTVGLFRRSDSGVNLGVAYDWLLANGEHESVSIFLLAWSSVQRFGLLTEVTAACSIQRSCSLIQSSS